MRSSPSALSSSSSTPPPPRRTGSIAPARCTTSSPRATPRLCPGASFHEARIVSRGPLLEHWLDGVLVASADTSTPEWAALVEDSKFKGVDGFAASGPGRLLIQDHGDEVWIRGMRVRELGGGGQVGTPLFGSGDTAGWSNVGDARYEVQGSTLIGRAGPQQQQSFLVSDREFGDFTMEVDVRIAVEGNSGIQLRSHVGGDGVLRGYQAEIDPSPRSVVRRALRRGASRLARRPLRQPGRAARPSTSTAGTATASSARAPSLRTWINGVPAADLLDGADLHRLASRSRSTAGTTTSRSTGGTPASRTAAGTGWVPQDPAARCALGGWRRAHAAASPRARTSSGAGSMRALLNGAWR